MGWPAIRSARMTPTTAESARHRTSQVSHRSHAGRAGARSPSKSLRDRPVEQQVLRRDPARQGRCSRRGHGCVRPARESRTQSPTPRHRSTRPGWCARTGTPSRSPPLRYRTARSGHTTGATRTGAATWKYEARPAANDQHRSQPSPACPARSATTTESTAPGRTRPPQITDTCPTDSPLANVPGRP
jgi:hypothetical protein